MWGGLRFFAGRTQEGGGGHSDAYYVQERGGGGQEGLQIGKKKSYVINGRPLILKSLTFCVRYNPCFPK